MSHIAVKKTKAGEPLIVDLRAAKMAAAALGLVCKEQSNYAWWGRHVGDFKIPKGFKKDELGNNAVLVLAVPDSRHEEMAGKYGLGYNTGKPYELAIVPDPNNSGCYTVMYDHIGGGYGLEEYIGHPIGANAKTGEADVLAPRFVQYYRMYADRLAANEAVDNIEFEPLPDGSWVSYTRANEERLRT